MQTRAAGERKKTSFAVDTTKAQLLTEMTEKLIECVKTHPFLYDVRAYGYKNLAMKAQVWVQIGKEINESAETAKKKWKSLRDNYGRYKKELSDPSVQAKKLFRWRWAKHLSFLDEPDRVRIANQNVRPTPPSQQYIEISIKEEDVESESSNTIYSVSPPVSPVPNNPAPETDGSLEEECSPQPKRRKREGDVPEQETDAVENLFKSYAQTFKSFSKRNQIAMKVELAQLFADIEAKEMLENSEDMNIKLI